MKTDRQYNWKSLYIELTSQCNLHCKYCYNDSDITRTIYLPTTQVKQLLDQAKQKNISDITLSGGEPLLHPDFPIVFDYCVEINQKGPTLITNASFINSTLLQKIVKSHTLLQLTIDGDTAELHGQTRDCNNFTKNIWVITELRNRYQYEGIFIRINVSLSNVERVIPICEMLIGMGIKHITIALVCAMGRGGNFVNMGNIYQKSYLDIINEQVGFIRNKYKEVDLKYSGVEDCLGCDFYSLTEYNLNLRIRYDGAIFPCQSFDSESHILGNICDVKITDDKFLQKLYDWIQKALIEKDKKMSKCHNCYCQIFCAGGCLAYILEDNASKHVLPLICEMKKISYKNQLLMD